MAATNNKIIFILMSSTSLSPVE